MNTNENPLKQTAKADISNLPAGFRNTEEKRLLFLRRGLFIGLVLELGFLFGRDIHSRNVLPLLLSSVSSVIFLIAFIASFKIKKTTRLFNAITLVAVLSTCVSLYGTAADTSIFFAAVAPLIAYLFLSRRGGVTWTLILSSSLVAIYLLDRAEILKMQISPKFLLSSIFSTIVLSSLLYIYERVNLANEKLIHKRDDELSELNRALNTQLENNKSTADKLEQTLESTQKNNQLLHDSKAALLNVLNDTNNLQIQLRAEKENVVKKVLERTAQLRFEQIRLRASINSVESGLLMVFKHEQEAIYNPALLRMLGLHPTDERLKNITSEVLLNIVQDVFKDTFSLTTAIDDSQKTAKPFFKQSVEIGDKFISVHGAPIISRLHTEVLGCVVIMEDLTQAMRLERSKDEFISIASHELRTPLTAIRGNASMLVTMYADQIPNEDVKGMIVDIKDASVRLIGIVNQFLSTSRLEQKRTVFKMTPVDIAKSIKTSIKELQELAAEKKLKLSANVPPDLPHVLADDARTGEIIVNVIGNAIKYTDAGSVTVTARVIKDFVEVDVEDTGDGIDPKNHDLLFHKFQQTNTNILTRDDSRSTGLGLYITKLLTEQMGGKIYLKRSELGKGSVFTFALPIAKTTE